MRAFYESRSYNPDIPVSVFKAVGMNFLAHWHTDVELVFVCDGHIRIGVNKDSRLLGKGDMAVFSSGDIHYYESSGMESTIIVVVFRPEIIGFSRGWPHNVRFETPFMEQSLMNRLKLDKSVLISVESAFQSLLSETALKREQYQMLIKSALYELCGTFMRYLPVFPIDTNKVNKRLSGLKLMQGVLDYIENNYTREITLGDAAGQAGLSVFHFSRLFKDMSGMNFKTFLNNVRISRAESLLKDSDLPVIDVAFESGFNSIRTFNRVFKAVKGCTPSGLR